MNDRGVRGLFSLVVAASAATLTDPLVESASNAGWFGSGSFTDHSTIDVLPVLGIAALAALTYVYLRARPSLASRSVEFARRLRASVASPSIATTAPRPSARLLLGTFALQLALLYVMETCEQIVVTGHALGGTVWLGAPIAIALALHAVACVLSACALAWILPELSRAAVALARFVRRSRNRLAGPARAAGGLSSDAPATAPAGLMATRLGKRAPPFLAA
jgi:hypothetical protein